MYTSCIVVRRTRATDVVLFFLLSLALFDEFRWGRGVRDILRLSGAAMKRRRRSWLILIVSNYLHAGLEQVNSLQSDDNERNDCRALRRGMKRTILISMGRWKWCHQRKSNVTDRRNTHAIESVSIRIWFIQFHQRYRCTPGEREGQPAETCIDEYLFEACAPDAS